MRILLALALIGCGTDGPHDVVTCGSGWVVDSIGQPAQTSAGCERECQAPPAGIGSTSMAPRCSVMDPQRTSAVECAFFKTADGTSGCCISDPGSVVAFYECTN